MNSGLDYLVNGLNSQVGTQFPVPSADEESPYYTYKGLQCDLYTGRYGEYRMSLAGFLADKLDEML